MPGGGRCSGPGAPLDTSRHAVIAANLPGSCYGSTGPAETNGTPFPALTPEDMARAHLPLLEHLGVDRLALVTGGSLGGMVALAWGTVSSVPVDRLVVFAAPAATSAQAIAWNTAQRMAIEADHRWQGGHFARGEEPVDGLAAARAIAMITYRSGIEFGERFGRGSTRHRPRYDVEHYLRRQGEKLVERFDARSYVALMGAMDAHDLGDLSVAGARTRERVAEVTGVGIDSDILYYPAEVRAWVRAYRCGGRQREIRGDLIPVRSRRIPRLSGNRWGRCCVNGKEVRVRRSSPRGRSPAPVPGSRDGAGSAPSP